MKVSDVSPYVAREMARLYPERWSYDEELCEFTDGASSEDSNAPQGSLGGVGCRLDPDG